MKAGQSRPCLALRGPLPPLKADPQFPCGPSTQPTSGVYSHLSLGLRGSLPPQVAELLSPCGPSPLPMSGVCRHSSLGLRGLPLPLEADPQCSCGPSEDVVTDNLHAGLGGFHVLAEVGLEPNRGAGEACNREARAALGHVVTMTATVSDVTAKS